MFETLRKLTTRLFYNNLIRSVLDGLINIIPLILVGTVVVALVNFPLPGFRAFMDGITTGYWSSFCELINDATFGIISIISLLSISSVLASNEAAVRRGDVNRIAAVLTAFCCYVILFGGIEKTESYTTLVLLRSAGAGMFYAVAVAIIAEKLLFLYVKIWDKLTRQRREVHFSNLQLRSAFYVVAPLFATLLSFCALGAAIDTFIGTHDIWRFVAQHVIDNLINDDFFSVIATTFLSQALWFIGINGNETVFMSFPFVGNITSGALPMFATQDFYLNFVCLGGAGATIGLLIALFIKGSKTQGQRFAKQALLPSLFNVNEVIVYGLPIVFNPFFVIPFMLSPLLDAAICFIAFSTGIVPPITAQAGWTTPVLISGFVATGSIAGSILQVVCIAVATICYVPFINVYGKYRLFERKDKFGEVQKAITIAADDPYTTIVTRSDNIGNMAREIAADVREYFKHGKVDFNLVYQPKTDAHGVVVGAEALLRWQHPQYGWVSPVMLIELADESGLSTELGRWITETAIAQYGKWRAQGMGDFVLSINLNPKHLEIDKDFVPYLAKLLQKHSVDPTQIELEITEHAAINSTGDMVDTFKQIRDLGIALSIDDMGMGYSSLTYISDYGVSSVKIDISLVDNIASDVQQQEIVRSIVALARQLNLKVVVEGTETLAQVEKLTELGCKYFQGYYFSRPLPPADFDSYIEQHGVL